MINKGFKVNYLSIYLKDQAVRSLESALETNKLLVSEYKDKNDTLNGLIAKFHSYATENEQLKEVLANERSSTQEKVNELNNHNKTLSSKTKELEQEKALLKAEREHQKSLSNANNAYTEKIQALYGKVDSCLGFITKMFPDWGDRIK